jgi:hypothetical protein
MKSSEPRKRESERPLSRLIQRFPATYPQPAIRIDIKLQQWLAAHKFTGRGHRSEDQKYHIIANVGPIGRAILTQAMRTRPSVLLHSTFRHRLAGSLSTTVADGNLTLLQRLAAQQIKSSPGPERQAVSREIAPDEY